MANKGDIAEVASALRSNVIQFLSDAYLEAIDPHWLETPEARLSLWKMVERLTELDNGE